MVSEVVISIKEVAERLARDAQGLKQVAESIIPTAAGSFRQTDKAIEDVGKSFIVAICLNGAIATVA